MKIERGQVSDQVVYDIMYFSPIEVGDERYHTMLYFQTDIYNRVWPVSKMEKMSAQIDQMRHVELGIHPFDEDFKHRHREMVLFHCKMSLAYLDAREARISMKLCEACEPATRSTEPRIAQDSLMHFDFLRVLTLSVMACSARRVKFYQKAMEALTEAKDICLEDKETRRVHPLLTALTLLNLSAVMGDIDHDEHGLKWGLEALSMMYDIFRTLDVPEAAKAYYLALACHNAALLNMKLQRWDDAVELVGEGIEFTKLLKEAFQIDESLPSNVDDGLRAKLIAIGAQAKHVPEGFLQEAVNALNGWGEERGVWNLSFWDFSVHEISEEIRVLQNTLTLKHLIIDHLQESQHPGFVEDAHLLRFILAVASCRSLEMFTVCGIDFDPRKVWRRIKKRSFLETSWYAATSMNYAMVLSDFNPPQVGEYHGLLKELDYFSKKLVLFLVILGNACEGVDLSANGLDCRCMQALVAALRSLERPDFAKEVTSLVLRNNALDAAAAEALAQNWWPGKPPPGKKQDGRDSMMEDSNSSGADDDDDSEEDEDDEDDDGEEDPGDQFDEDGCTLFKRNPTVTSLDVSHNRNIGDQGFHKLTEGIAQYHRFKHLSAIEVGLGPEGCSAVETLDATELEILCLSDNAILSEGAKIVSQGVMKLVFLHTLELSNCSIDEGAAVALADMVAHHDSLTNLCLNDNNLGDVGCITLCGGAAKSHMLSTLRLTYNNISSVGAAEAIGQMMRKCESLREINLSGNVLDPKGSPHVGSAIEHSKVLKMYLEDMCFNESSIDDFLDHGAAESQDLQVMILNNNPVGDEGLGIIAECLSIGLTELSLSNCNLTAHSQATLLNLVSLSPNLKSLNLSHNNLGPHGCSDMVAWMTQNEKEQFSLRSLELASCGLGDEGLLQLVSILGSLNYLGVRDNGITSAGLEAVMNSNQMIQLNTLDLANNAIGEQGVHALTERFQQEHKRSLWNPKQLTSTIDVVILTNNQISKGLAMSTECFLKIHNPLLTVHW
jgi:Ran GTPase-activating protein (RanGAP) involved in mRNA processing and transport